MSKGVYREVFLSLLVNVTVGKALFTLCVLSVADDSLLDLTVGVSQCVTLGMPPDN